MRAKQNAPGLVRCVLLIVFCLISGRVIANAQRIDWNLKDAQEVTSPLHSLPTQDQQGIARRLQEKPENLRAVAVQTAAGHIFLVQGTGDWCGASNCEFWVISSDYKVLLKKVTQAFKLQPASHLGFPDIVTSMHGSAFESGLSYWQFQGRRYVRVACADAVYEDAGGNTVKLAHVSPRRCGTGS